MASEPPWWTELRVTWHQCAAPAPRTGPPVPPRLDWGTGQPLGSVCGLDSAAVDHEAASRTHVRPCFSPRGCVDLLKPLCTTHGATSGTCSCPFRHQALFAPRAEVGSACWPTTGVRSPATRRTRNGDQPDLAANPYPERGRPSHLPISRLDHPTVSTLRTRWTGLERVSLWPSRGPTLMAPARAVQGTPRNCLVARPRVLGPCQRCRSSPRQTAPRPMPPVQWASGTTSRGERAAAWMLPRRCW